MAIFFLTEGSGSLYDIIWAGHARGKSMNPKQELFLELVREIKIEEILRDVSDRRYETSGIFARDNFLHIIFDDDPHLLRIHQDLNHDAGDFRLQELNGSAGGYEDITYQFSAGRWVCLVEAAKAASGTFMPHVDIFDESFGFIESAWLDFPLKAGNKGFEGLAFLHREGNEYLLGLCEGNKCKSGKAGAKPGKGRIQIFRCGAGAWEHAGTIKLPKAVLFEDYSGLDLSGNRMSVVSQASSALWIGRVRALPIDAEDPFEDDGQIFFFPRDDKGRIIYGNVEGITWLSNDQLAVVSDKAKAGQPKRCARKDQSIHIFRLPNEA